MLNYLPINTCLLLSFLSIQCFCLDPSYPKISDNCPYRQRDFRLLAKAINDALNFFKDHVDDLVLDAAVGTRILEGQINVILKAKPTNLPQHVHNFLIKTLLKSTGISERIIRNVQNDFTVTEEHKNGTLHWVKNPEVWELPPINSWKHIKEETREYNLSKVYKNPASAVPFGQEILNEELSDLCIGQLFKYCNVSKNCEQVFLKSPLSMYSLTHQVLFMLFAKQLNCTANAEFQSKIGNGNWKDFDELLCSRVYDEAVLIADHGFPDKHQDLFAEQVAVCSLLGFRDFLQVDWMYENIFWEKSLTAVSGCFTNFESDFHRSSFTTTGTEDENTNSTVSETPPKRIKRSDVFIGLKGEDDEHCSVHFTAVSIAALSMHMRNFLESCVIKV